MIMWRRKKYMQTITQSYNANLHLYQKQMKKLSLKHQHYMKPGKINVDAKVYQTSKKINGCNEKNCV